MRARIALLAAAVMAVFLWVDAAVPAHGAVCSTRGNFLAELRSQHNEAVAYEGLAASGDFMEILVSPEGKTWTVLITRPSGVSCVVVVGSDFEIVKPAPAKKGEPS